MIHRLFTDWNHAYTSYIYFIFFVTINAILKNSDSENDVSFRNYGKNVVNDKIDNSWLENKHGIELSINIVKMKL